MLAPILMFLACFCFSGLALQCHQNPTRTRSRRFPFALYAAKANSFAKKVPKSERQLGNALESCLETSLNAGKEAILVVDANNVRGKEDFKMTNSDLLKKLRDWKSQCYPSLNIVCCIDHGSLPAIFPYDGLGLVEFAGPNRTADDVIAQSARWFTNASVSDDQRGYEEQNKDLDVFIVTSDGGLRIRCLRANNRMGNSRKKRQLKENIKVFASPQLLQSFEQIKSVTIEHDIRPSNSLHMLFEQTVLEVESDLRMYEQLRPPWPSAQAKLDAQVAGPWKCSVLSSNSKSEFETVPFDFPRETFQENTWNRILVAENMRRMMQQLSASSSWSTDSLGQLLTRYQLLHESSLMKRNSHPSTMVFDRRIRYEVSLQLELIQYLEAAIASTSAGASFASVEYESAVESAARILKEMIEEDPEKTSDEILLRYMNEAPRRLQFPNKQDLRKLLQFIAVRGKREGSSRKQWRLLTDHPSLDCWPTQPGQTRRRHRKRYEERKSPPIDEALLTRGADAEEQWFQMAKWQIQFENELSTAKYR
eukprot:scaffold992_cov116-Cylindrotheca_fusiformis.AAC.14